ncbi:SDR family oxidoreductase [Luteimicrobium sp. DT211]|uniref:SDR family oxidoreductase n=1 Tax=Luteimicrobium sp. DT211 TaxID=3393412 RepID=UPI003CE6DED5
MKIVVIGGTGRIGSQVVAQLREQGHEAVPAAPSTGVNTLTGEGLAEALAGADAVADVSGSPTFEPDEVLDFFRRSTSNLLAAEQAAGVGRHVALSIVGTRRQPENAYFRAKVAQEDLIEASSAEWTIVHATQFFEFLPTLADYQTVDGVVRVPPVAFQPIATRDVAAAVAHAVLNGPARTHVEVAGPERFRYDELLRQELAEAGDPREVVTDPDARYWGAVVDDHSLVPEGEHVTLGATTLAEWKQAQAAGSAA